VARLIRQCRKDLRDDVWRAGGKWFGSPAQPDRQAKRQLIALRHLPELIRRVDELEKLLGSPAPPPKPAD